MALQCNVGLPGSGKTEYLTYMALKHYKQTNSLLRRTIRKIMKKEEWINNVYTNYPVCLDLKKKIYSNIVSIDDLDNSYSFQINSFIGIDEPQIKDDSQDFKEFPRGIGMWLQLHRHFGIRHIAFATQHPNRLVIYEKNIMSLYNRLFNTFKIPFTPYKLVVIRNCYELVDYDFIATRDRDVRRQHDIKRHFKLYNAKKVHKHYDDKYMSVLNDDKPLLNKGQYTSLKLTTVQMQEYLNYFENNSAKRMRKKKDDKNNKLADRSRTGGASASVNYNFFNKN